jgi:hypothetical protein
MAPRSNDPRSLILDDAVVVIAKAARNGGIVRTTEEAIWIARRHPDSGMTPADISNELFKLAVAKRLAVDPSA